MTFGSVDSFSPHLWAIESKYRTHSGKLLVSSAPEFFLSLSTWCSGYEFKGNNMGLASMAQW